MKRLIFLVSLAILYSTSGHSQGLTTESLRKSPSSSRPATPCGLTVSKSPELRGLKLGLSIKEFEKKFPKAKLPDADEVGGRTLNVSAALPSGMDLSGTKNVQLQFLDDRLVDFKIVYDNSVRWFSVDKFVEAISAPLKLPSVWGSKKYYDQARELNCQDFLISAFSGPSEDATLEFSQHGILEKIIERRGALDKKRQKEFKP